MQNLATNRYFAQKRIDSISIPIKINISCLFNIGLVNDLNCEYVVIAKYELKLAFVGQNNRVICEYFIAKRICCIIARILTVIILLRVVELHYRVDNNLHIIRGQQIRC